MAGCVCPYDVLLRARAASADDELVPTRSPGLRRLADVGLRGRGQVTSLEALYPEVLDVPAGRVYTGDMTTPAQRPELEPDQLAQFGPRCEGADVRRAIELSRVAERAPKGQ